MVQPPTVGLSSEPRRSHLSAEGNEHLGQVIELCRHCGFDIPGDADRCPWCAPAAPSLAARQVAGLALRTRSVHPLQAIPPRRERAARSLGPADGARSAFGYTWLFVVLTLVGAGLSWTARLDRFVLSLPAGTSDFMGRLAEVTGWASIVALAVGLVALAHWSVRRIGVARARRRAQHLIVDVR